MKVGDLVRHRDGDSTGMVVDMTQRKVWRSSLRVCRIDWDKIQPEPHAVVLWSHNDGTIEIPLEELEPVDESR